jgi:hypothetical protein
MNNQKSCCLAIQVLILAQDTPRIRRDGCRLVRIVWAVTKGLDVADDLSVWACVYGRKKGTTPRPGRP